MFGSSSAVKLFKGRPWHSNMIFIKQLKDKYFVVLEDLIDKYMKDGLHILNRIMLKLGHFKKFELPNNSNMKVSELN